MKQTRKTVLLIAVALKLSVNAQWMPLGNNILSTDFIGGTSASTNPLVFKTNGFERMRVLGNMARLGIGVTNPSQSLDLIDNLSIRGTHLVFNSQNGVINWGNGSGDLYFRRLNTQGNQNSHVTYMTLKGDGKLGIGISQPNQKLHVHDGAIFVTGSNSLGGPMIVFGGGTTSDPNGQWGIEYNSIDLGLNFWRPSPANNSGNYFLFLNDNGNVGIGTKNTVAKLTVNGKALIGDPALININTTGNYKLYVQDGILTEKVKVALVNTSDWSDYVFENNYKLKPLQEVETFVKEKKHLPGVPSAEDLKEQGGFDVALMDAKLLEKIEELTLYVIELNKQNKQLNEKLTELEVKIIPESQRNH